MEEKSKGLMCVCLCECGHRSPGPSLGVVGRVLLPLRGHGTVDDGGHRKIFLSEPARRTRSSDSTPHGP